MAARLGNRLMTTEEVADYLGLHPQTVYKKARVGDIPSVKIGRQRRYRREEIERWVDHQGEGREG